MIVEDKIFIGSNDNTEIYLLPKLNPEFISILFTELLLYKSLPSLKGEIKLFTPLNNLIGVAELDIKYLKKI